MAEGIAAKSSKGKCTEQVQKHPADISRQPVPTSPYGAVLALQRSAGNHAVNHLLGQGVRTLPSTGGFVQRECACGNNTMAGGECEECSKKKLLGLQTKLKINEPGDIYEQEADRIADQVMATPEHPVVSSAPPRIQRFSGQSNGQMDAAPSSVDQALASPGRPLEPALRQDMEQRFGYDFSQVRVHSGAAAEQSARDVSAHAYTVGHNIVFDTGRFVPGTREGRRLLAHELTHVVQHTGDAGASAPASMASSPTLRRTTDPYAGVSIAQLRKRAATEPAVAEELWKRFSEMSNTDLERYARNDPMAQSIYAQRNISPKDAAGQGRFSKPEIEGALTQDIVNARAQGPKRTAATPVAPGVETEGGTMGVARTDIPGLENEAIIGKSPQAGGKLNPSSQFPPATDPKELPQTHAHAEQHIADQFSAKLKSVPRENLKGRTIWMLIEQEPCSTCAQGTMNPNTARGVLKKLSDAFPELRFEIKNLNTSGRIVLEARPAAAGASPAVPAAPGPKLGAGTEPPSINKPPPQVTGETPAPSAPKVPAVEPPVATPKLPSAVAEGATPKVPSVVGEGAAPKVPSVVGEGAAPKVPPIEVPGAGRGTVRGGLGGGGLARGAGRAGAAALEGAVGLALGIAMLAADLIIELIIVPKLLEWQRKLEAGRRQYLEQKIQKYFEQFESGKVSRQIRNCYLTKLRELEAAGKTPYVKVTLMVRLEDTSNRFQLFTETPPESFFDFEFDSAEVALVSLTDKPVEASVGEMKRCESCGTFGRDKTFISNNPLWEQSITFSFVSPTSAALTKEYPETADEKLDPSCACFIATACFGSMLAPEVMRLRRFRDRCLMQYPAGRLFVRVYYRTSPPIAVWLEQHAFARALVREGFVRPLATLVRWISAYE